MKDKFNVAKWFVLIAIGTILLTQTGCSAAWRRGTIAKDQLKAQKEQTVQLTRIADSLESINNKLPEQ